MEILVDTPRIKDLIKHGQIDELAGGMESAIYEGCQTFDQDLFRLYKQGQITLDHALANSDSANNLRLKIKLDEAKGNDMVAKLLENNRRRGDKQLRIHGVESSSWGSVRKL